VDVVPTGIVGGVVVGVVNWALPLTVGRGYLQTDYLLQYGARETSVSMELLLCSGFARMFLLGVSAACGLKGGTTHQHPVDV
jgi:hypothetical protein